MTFEQLYNTYFTDVYRFAVWLNDAHLYDVADDTFQAAGKIGLWTKADSVTAFDDLTLTSNEIE